MENPITGVVVLLFIALIAYIGNRNSNQKTITKTVDTILEDYQVVKKVERKQRTDFIELPTQGSCGKTWGKDRPF
ncbi:TPA: hypothetical protein ACGMXD_002075 [Streptococcus agalactiae]|uniref:hypothetical protein n=1 Tax=Streptococcus agalactiae TaxID=1311 RepID=UPI0002B94216|nr:hypothetical protein [Streptococcus agalactiae]EPU00484.1 hypothetical protein SAG0109_06660 [Streptococcus agalactiae BSU108]KAA8965869.1 hypothetical protein F3148_08350 [Streptococcus agalactiae]KAA8985606.1 hypothetical protein F3163_08920 [Streptococcus agalactiae]KAA9062923.1 hypothetical protein F5H66_01945 [Streptococcus agalactiae]KAA9095172.1 hypothetical protein F5W94_11270 [Streptococcus agalactiae]